MKNTNASFRPSYRLQQAQSFSYARIQQELIFVADPAYHKINAVSLHKSQPDIVL